MEGESEVDQNHSEETLNVPLEKKEETREDVLSRHRKEISQLQGKEISLKKAAAKGSKAEQKTKKKQVEEEIANLSAKLKEKHAEELASLGYGNNNSNKKGGSGGDIDTLVKAIAGVSVTTNQTTDKTKRSKGHQRREKRAEEEAAREQRIIEEQMNVTNVRVVENEKLERKLEPLGLRINEIKADGNCLYRAVVDQLILHSGGSSPYNYQQLRKMVADYMRNNSSDFLPFFHTENLLGGEKDESLAVRFENYCNEIESTAAWGGQLELGALTHCLKKHILVYSASFPDVEMGKEYKSKGAGSGSLITTILLSYHVHAFGLGEHYNSVVPIP